MKILLTIALVVCFLVGDVQACEGDTSGKTDCESSKKHSPYIKITAEKLRDMMKDDEHLVVIDSRGGKYFDGEMIKGAINLSVKDTDSESLSKVLKTKSSPVVFYCTNESCPASSLAAHKASYAGYKNLYKYSGGIEGWKKKGFPTVKIK